MLVTNSNSISFKDKEKEKENEIIVKSIVYGSVAFWLGKKADETVSHKWSVYVRGINNEDISYFVKEVVFTLHASFENHVRVVNKFPFELYESGWGQFDIIITIHLIDENARPIEFVHPLKLYPSQTHVSMSTKKPVVSENYDDIIFVNPKPEIREILMNPPIRKESAIQIPMSIEEDKKSNDYSIISNEERMVVVSEKNYKRDFNQMNLNSQMEMVPSQVITGSSNARDEMNVDMSLNYKSTTSIAAEYNDMNVDMKMNEDPLGQVNQNENYSVTSYNMDVDKDKKREDKKVNSSYIPNITQYYMPVDDTPHFKILEDANKFVLQEINRLRKSLEDTDKDIINVKKIIKEIASKI